jgi:hypothetical protein
MAGVDLHGAEIDRAIRVRRRNAWCGPFILHERSYVPFRDTVGYGSLLDAGGWDAVKEHANSSKAMIQQNTLHKQKPEEGELFCTQDSVQALRVGTI